MKNKISLPLVYITGLLLFFSLPGMTRSIEKSTMGNIDYSSYLIDVQSRIKHNWHPPRADKPVTPVVVFKITKSGQIIDAKIKHATSNTQIDQSVLEAIAGVGMVPPPPGNKDIDIEFTFDYKIRTHSRLHSNWKHYSNLENIAHDLTDMKTYRLLGNELAQGHFKEIGDKFGDLFLLLGFWLMVGLIIYWRVKYLFSFRFRLPDPAVLIIPVSSSEQTNSYPKNIAVWDRFCQVDLLRLALVTLFSSIFWFCGLKYYRPDWFPKELNNTELYNWNQAFFNSISSTDSLNFFWGGVLIFFLVNVFLFGYPRYFRRLKEIVSTPGRQAIITINRGPGNFPYMARIERFVDGMPVETGTIYLGVISHPSFPEQLPLTGNADVYFDERSHEPVAIFMFGGFLYRQHTALFRRSLFMPWIQ